MTKGNILTKKLRRLSKRNRNKLFFLAGTKYSQLVSLSYSDLISSVRDHITAYFLSICSGTTYTFTQMSLHAPVFKFLFFNFCAFQQNPFRSGWDLWHLTVNSESPAGNRCYFRSTCLLISVPQADVVCLAIKPYFAYNQWDAQKLPFPYSFSVKTLHFNIEMGS